MEWVHASIACLNSPCFCLGIYICESRRVALGKNCSSVKDKVSLPVLAKWVISGPGKLRLLLEGAQLCVGLVHLRTILDFQLCRDSADLGRNLPSLCLSPGRTRTCLEILFPRAHSDSALLTGVFLAQRSEICYAQGLTFPKGLYLCFSRRHTEPRQVWAREGFRLRLLFSF